MKPCLRRWLLPAMLLASGATLAQSAPTALPEWDRLSAQQREVLLAPLRERWNSEPAQRTRMLEHAQRWQDMTPEQRRQARKGMRRFEGMAPEQRHEARALFHHMRALDPEQRKQLRAQWRGMTPDQRRAWVERNPPPEGRDGD
jgi:hypothetical protein